MENDSIDMIKMLEHDGYKDVKQTSTNSFLSESTFECSNCTDEITIRYTKNGLYSEIPYSGSKLITDN